MKSWAKITINTLTVFASLPFLLRLSFPSYFADVKCVGKLPDDTIVKAAEDDCESDRFESVVILEMNEEGAIGVSGDEAMIFEP